MFEHFWEGFEKQAATALMKRIAKSQGKTPKELGKDKHYQLTKKILSDPKRLSSRRKLVEGVVRQGG